MVSIIITIQQSIIYIGVGEGGQPPPRSRLEVIRANLEHIRENLKTFGQTCKQRSFLRDHTNPKKKEEIFGGDLFYFILFYFGEYTMHLEIFCFEHSIRFSPSPQTVLLSYGHDYLYKYTH